MAWLSPPAAGSFAKGYYLCGFIREDNLLMTRILTLLSLWCWLHPLAAQVQPSTPSAQPFADIQLHFDTLTYSWLAHGREIGGRRYLTFAYTESQASAEVWFVPKGREPLRRLTLLPSSDYQAQDSTLLMSEGHYRSRIKFTSLSRQQSPTLLYRVITGAGDTVNVEVPLFPVTEPKAMLPPEERIWYIGQEQEVPIETPMPRNLRPMATWEKTQGVAYRVVQKEGVPSLRVVPLTAGTRTLSLPIQTHRPALINDQLIYDHVLEPFEVTIKRGRTQFIALDRDVVELPRGAHIKEVQVKFDLQVSLNVKRSYRLEAQESAGGPVVAELFINEVTNSNQMKATLRVYAYHRRNQGLLYLKQQDETLFTLNLDIVPTPHLDEVMIRRPGGEWLRDLRVYPGETLDIRLRGESLTRSNFVLNDLVPLRNDPNNDSISYTEEKIQARINIPVGTDRKAFPLMMDDAQTPYTLLLREYQRPQQLGFVRLTYEGKTRPITEVRTPLVVDAPLNQFLFRFQRDSIDLPGELYGPQYLTIAVEVWSADGRKLSERREQTFCICPGTTSPRKAIYEELECVSGVIELNDLLETPSYELPGWSRIRLEVAHAKGRYEQPGQSRQVDIVLRQSFEIGLEVSLPVPIILARFNGTGTDNLTSVGFAAFAQLRLYRKRGINELVPIQASLGVMATDVFTFKSEARRDWGVCAMASFYPITGNKQSWSVPLYVGGGYLLGEGTGFFFMGPGLSVQF
jgi:hypothetical protein